MQEIFWLARKKEADTARIFPLGDATERAHQLFLSIKSKIDDYFLRCRLASFDSQTTAVLNLQIARVESITAKDLSLCIDEIATYPLAKIEAGLALPLIITNQNHAGFKYFSIKTFKW